MFKQVLEDFRDFIAKGSALDLAVGIIIGTAFKDIVNSLVNDILTPPLGLLLGQVDFTDLFINLSGEHYASLARANEAGAPTINYGVFLNTILSFLITAVAIFLVVRGINWAREQPQKKAEAAKAPQPPTTKKCPYCLTEIPIAATRCPNCTSQLEDTA